MSFRLRTIPILTVIGAMALAVPTLARDPIVVNGGEDNDIAPFRVLTEKSLQCSGEVFIEIDNIGSDEFVVTSILVQTSGFASQDSAFLEIESVEINNVNFDTPTLIASVDFRQLSNFESVDLMGTSLEPGANFPHQIVAKAFSDGVSDIRVTLRCNFDSDVDFTVEAVAISGWKQAGDEVTLDYFDE